MRMARRIRQSGDLSSDGETDVLGQCRYAARSVTSCSTSVPFAITLSLLTARVADKSIVLARITC
jgi:hypothetical protein